MHADAARETRPDVIKHVRAAISAPLLRKTAAGAGHENAAVAEQIDKIPTTGRTECPALDEQDVKALTRRACCLPSIFAQPLPPRLLVSMTVLTTALNSLAVATRRQRSSLDTSMNRRLAPCGRIWSFTCFTLRSAGVCVSERRARIGRTPTGTRPRPGGRDRPLLRDPPRRRHKSLRLQRRHAGDRAPAA